MTKSIGKNERLAVLNLSHSQREVYWNTYVSIPKVRKMRQEYLKYLTQDELHEWVIYLYHTQEMSTHHIASRLYQTQDTIKEIIAEFGNAENLSLHDQEIEQPEIVDISDRNLRPGHCAECTKLIASLREEIRVLKEEAK